MDSFRKVMFYKFPHIYLINVEGNVNSKICNIIVQKYSGKKFFIKSDIPILADDKKSVESECKISRSSKLTFDNNMDRDMGVIMDQQSKLGKKKHHKD